MITVIYHSADFDGLFCCEIAKHFLGEKDVNYIGWNFGDKPFTDTLLSQPLVVMDLPLDKLLGIEFKNGWICKDGDEIQPIDRWDSSNITWIDHHKSSIDSHPGSIPGYRIDGVAACRLAWQWFMEQARVSSRPCPGCGAIAHPAKVACEQGKPCPHCGGIHWGSAFCPYTEDSSKSSFLPPKQYFLDRKVSEPLAVRLAGEYDVWDHRGDGDLEFQFGLRSEKELKWDVMLSDKTHLSVRYTRQLVVQGKLIMEYSQGVDVGTVNHKSFLVEFEGLKFLALNTARCNSLTFAAKDIPETGHDGLLAFFWNGKEWNVSMYHASHRKDIDLSEIAKRLGGGGHRGACGFQTAKLPFLP